MNTFDEALIYGFFLGVTDCAALALGLRLARDEGRDTILLSSDYDAPFRAVTDNDLRLVRVCDSCRRYLGESRTLTAGQHLSILPTTCPRCAKRAAIAAAPKPQNA